MIQLKTGKEKSIVRGHPWIFSGAVARHTGQAGDVVEVHSQAGSLLGHALLNPASQIIGRMIWLGKEPLPEDWFTKRVASAFARRKYIVSPQTTAYRAIHGEADELPGLVCDVYGDTAVVQINAWGFDTRRDELSAALKAAGMKAAYARGDSESRKREGLPAKSEPLFGEAKWIELDVLENGLHFRVNAATGHKTGFYLDQRENRQRLRELSQGARLLNLCSYTGGFTVAAAAGGAKSYTSVDTSQAAIDDGKRHMIHNHFDPGNWVQADVFNYLREVRDAYDIVVLDPPAFAKSKTEVEHAARGYKDINRLALKRLVVGGWMFTFSCSHHISTDLFQKIVFSAADETGASMQVVRRLSAGEDHPFHLRHPEGEYLKGLLLRRIG